MSLTALDYEEIRQLHARYSCCVDFEDADGITTCFAPDGRFNGLNNFPVGSEQLRQFVIDLGPKQNGHCRHTILYSLIEGDGDTARSVSYATITRDYGLPEGKGQVPHAVILTGGFYLDEMVRQNGRWVYASRDFLHDGRDKQIEDLLFKPLKIAHVDAGVTEGDELSDLDLEAIRQLTARYCYTLDMGDVQGLVDCFTPDGSFGSPTQPIPVDGAKRLGEWAKEVAEIMGGHGKHTCVNVVIEGNSRSAGVSSTGFISGDLGSVPSRRAFNNTLGMTGLYKDHVVKVDGRWLYKRRSFAYDGWLAQRGEIGKPIGFEPFYYTADEPKY